MSVPANLGRINAYAARWPTAPPWFVAMLMLLCLLPFINKAYHIDDPLFIWAARQIQTNPLDFYGFDVNWYGVPMPMHEVMKNPPLTSYYLAVTAALLGWSEPALHTAMLLPTVMAGLGALALARRLSPHPQLAAVIFAVAPATIICAGSVMSDMPMLALWLWAMVFWVDGLQRDHLPRLLLAGVLIAAAALTKYFAISLIPLLLVHGSLVKRRPGIWLFGLLLPLVLLGGYQWITLGMYGRGLLLDAASYARDITRSRPQSLMAGLLVLLAFTGACALPVWFVAVRMWSRRARWGWLGAITALAAIVTLMPPRNVPGFRDDVAMDWPLALQVAIAAIGGMMIVLLALRDVARHRDASSWLLLLWVAGTMVFTGFVNWTISARNLAPLLPALGILVARAEPPRGTAWLVLPALIISMMAAWADASLANVGRVAPQRLTALYRAESPLWFEGHWGFQYYMQESGHRAVAFNDARIKVGDLVIRPRNNTNVLPLPKDSATPERMERFAVFPWMTTMDVRHGGAFYSSVWGPMPFVIARAKPQEVEIWRAVRDIDFIPPR